jgi:hypothetical protein
LHQKQHPAVVWKPYQTRRSTSEQIGVWWGRTPNLNLGIVTGVISGLMVADLDPRNDPTDETTAWLTKLMPPPPSVITPKGWHWYVADVGLPTLPRLRPGLDLKAAGGYVLAPPSVHPCGKVYERLSDRLILVPDAPSRPSWAPYGRGDGISSSRS